jgi:hypothetical protein
MNVRALGSEMAAGQARGPLGEGNTGTTRGSGR